MIKGINRQIIEDTETGSIYYERALLVVRPEYASAQRALLEREARRMLKTMKAPSVIKPKRSILLPLLRLILIAAVTSLITLLLYTALPLF